MSGRGERILVAAAAVAFAMMPVSRAAAAPGQLQGLSLADSLYGGRQFREASGSSGAGVVVAVIDTGVDVAHPALAGRPDGGPKVVDWADFTDEGLVALEPKSIRAPSWLPSLSGTYMVGRLREEDLDGSVPFGGDLNGDGTSKNEFVVVAADSKERGVYDLVAVDQNGDGDVFDERPMRPFRLSRNYGRFGRRSTGVSFLVADLDPEGRYVRLGFDGNGHGTHVAGIVAGYGQDSSFTGVAPGSSIVAIKALSSSGEGSWDRLSKAVEYAVDSGAQVVCLSTAGPSPASSSSSSESRFFETLGMARGALFVVAAGNAGPGLGSASAPGGGAHVLAVGGYVPDRPARVWEWSGVGPRPDGGVSPNVVAPASASSCVPCWMGGDGYDVFTGTSVSTAFAAGACALLFEAVGERAGVERAVVVKRALEAGARQLDGAAAAEQGYGAVDLMAAWKAAEKAEGASDLKAVTRLGGEYQEGGIVTDGTPGRIVQYISNFGQEAIRLSLSELPPWLGANRPRITIGPVSQRAVLYEGVGDAPGGSGVLRDGFIRWDDPATAFSDLDVFAASLDPVPLRAENSRRAVFKGTAAGGSARHLFSVETWSERIAVSVKARSATGSPSSLSAMLFGPDGALWAFGRGFFPAAVGGRETGGECTPLSLEVPWAAPGTWELVIQANGGTGQEPWEAAYEASVLSDGDLIDLTGGELSGWSAGAFRAVARPSSRQREVSLSAKVRDGSPGRVAAVGLERIPLGSRWEEFVAERLFGSREVFSIPAGEAALRLIPAVPEGTRWLVVGAREVDADGAGLNLELYRYSRPGDEWHKCASSSSGDIHLFMPEPGEYAAVAAPAPDGEEVGSFELWWLVLEDHGAASVRESETGEADVRIQLPRESGRYLGYVILEDQGRIAGLCPIVLDKGLSELLVTASPEVLVAGRPAFIKISVIDRLTLEPFRGSILVNGREHALVDGAASLLVSPPPEARQVRIEVRVDDSDHAFTSASIALPVVMVPKRELD